MAGPNQRESREVSARHHGTKVREKPKNVKRTLARIMKYVIDDYKLQFAIIVLAIIGSSLSSVAGTYFLKPVINDYVVPLIGQESPDMSGFASMLLLMAVIYLFGIFLSYLYNRLMLNISTGTLRRVRVDLFTHMQDLPIGYFDTHTHGELMSRFTNDVDTLREMISNGIHS